MVRLLSRQKFIPNGFKFYDANLKWTAPANASFQTICDGLLSARKANPGLTAAKGLSTDPNAIAEEVDFYNASICQQMGWTDFYTGSGGGAAAVPFPQAQVQRPPPTLLQRSRHVAAGSKTIVEWIASKEQAVPSELSAKRAERCSKCQLNVRGNLSDVFTTVAAEAIRLALQTKNGWNLTTPFDDVLGVCGGCSCVNALSVHCPLEIKLKHMPKEAFDALDVNCWCRTEQVK